MIKHASGVAHDIRPRNQPRSIGCLSSVVETGLSVFVRDVSMCRYAYVRGRARFVDMTADVKRRMVRVPEADTASVILVLVDVVQVPEPSVRGKMPSCWGK